MAESVTSLRLKVDSTDVKNAEKDLNNLTRASVNTEKSTGMLYRSFASLSTILGTIGVAALIKEFINIADQMNLVDSRLKMVSASTAEYVAQQKALLSISKDTYSSVSDITTLYTKLNPALKAIGATTKDVNNITSSFSKGLKLGGANTAEAASATLQFAQAMGSGVLRGEEFNAIAEASPKLMQYLADGLGVPITSMRKLAQEGELTSGKVGGALLKMSTQINEDFTQIPITVGMATTNLKTDLSIAIMEFDKTTGATKALAETISGLSADLSGYTKDVSNFYLQVSKFIQDHNEALKTSAALVAGVATAYYGFIAGGAVITGIRGITTAVYGLRTAMIALQASSPILLAISVGLGVATAAYLAHDDALEKKNYSTIGSIDELVKSHQRLLDKRKEIQGDKFALDKTQRKETAIVDAELKKIENRLNAIGTAQSNNVAKAKKEAEEVAKSAKTLEDNASKLQPAKEKKEKKKGKTDSEIEAERISALTKSLNEEVIKSEQAVTLSMLDEFAKRRKKLEFDRDEDLKKFKGVKDAEAKIQEIFNNNISLLNAEQKKKDDDFALQTAIEATQKRKALLKEEAKQKADNEIKFNEMTISESEKINSEMKALYESILDENGVSMFPEDQMQTFFTKWQESIEGVKGGYNDIQGIVSSFVEDSLNSKDWTAGLTGTAKSVANLGNAFKDLDKQNKKYETARKKVAKSSLNDEEKSIANKEIENAQYYAQIDAYGALAGAAAGFFEQGSSMAKAMAVVQGGLAIVSAGAGGDPITVIPRMIAAAAMVAQTLSQSGISSGGGGSKAPDYSQTIKEASFASGKGVSIGDYRGNFDKFIEGLDSAAQKLEDFGSVGSSLSERLTTLTNTLNSYQEIVDRWTKILGVRPTFADDEIKQVTDEISSILTEAVQDSLDYSTMSVGRIGELVGSIDLVAYNNTLAQINDLALKAKQAGGILSEADKQTLIELYTLPNYIKAQDYEDALEIFKEFTEKSVENIKSFNDSFKTDEQLLNDLHSELGRGSIAKTIPQLMDLFETLKQGVDGLTDSELEFLEANKALLDSNIEIKTSLFDNIQSFVDGLKDSIIAKDTATTFNTFSSSFNSMIDAIIDGSQNMGEAGNTAINNARSYLDTVSATATSARDISFAKAVIANRFSDIVATPDTSLNTINSTLNSNNAQLVAELQSLKFELQSLKQLNITQTATQIKTLSTQRAVLGEMVS